MESTAFGTSSKPARRSRAVVGSDVGPQDEEDGDGSGVTSAYKPNLVHRHIDRLLRHYEQEQIPTFVSNRQIRCIRSAVIKTITLQTTPFCAMQSDMDTTYNINGSFKPTIKRFADLSGPDFFPTPRWATHALIDNEEFEGDIWECLR